jgi:tripartite-type tricarboxylate transporter receptor subunit TctC
MRATVRLAASLLCLVAALVSATGAAQGYPTRPIRFIAPFPPGGSSDVLCRLLGQKLTERLGQPVAVENRPGAGGNIGHEFAAKQAPDGYTILISSSSTLATNPHLYKHLGFDPIADFAPISMVASAGQVLVVNPSVPAKSVAELIALAKAKPGQLNFGSGGKGIQSHISAEMFKAATGVDIVHVPYKGTAPSLTDLVGGQVAMTMTGAPAVMPHVRAGRLRALGVSSTFRIEVAPELPTIAESGVPGFDATQWYGILVPAGTPRDIVMTLNTATRRIMQSKEVKERLAGEGAIAASGTPEEFAAHIKREMARWAEVVHKAGMKVD